VSADFDALLDSITTPRGGMQLALVAASFVLAWAIARVVRARLPADLEPGLAKISAGSAHRLVLPLLLLVLVWLSRLILGKIQPVPLLHFAVLLIASFALIRLAIYLLRHLIAPSAFLKASERIIVYGIWIVVALHITGVLPDIMSAMEDVGASFGKQRITLRLIVEALLSAGVTVFCALSISGLIEKRIMTAESLDISSRVVIAKFLRAFALVVALMIALPLVGIDLTVLSVFGGALGVGLGFGLQKIASNYVSGFIILLDRSIRMGDLITVDSRHGVVAAINARYTVLRGLDGTEAIIPNDTLITNTVINHSYTDPSVAVKTGVTVAYDTDLERACALMLDAARSCARVQPSPEPTVYLKELADNGIELEITVWIRDPDMGQSSLRSELLLRVWKAYKAAGISVPFPQREVRILGGEAMPAQAGERPETNDPTGKRA
jgi:small-conductance mechanosensitive channel